MSLLLLYIALYAAGLAYYDMNAHAIELRTVVGLPDLSIPLDLACQRLYFHNAFQNEFGRTALPSIAHEQGLQ